MVDPITQADSPSFERDYLPVDTLARLRPRSQLYEDMQDCKVIAYQRLETVGDSKCLIDVASKVYVLEESVLEAGIDDCEEFLNHG